MKNILLISIIITSIISCKKESPSVPTPAIQGTYGIDTFNYLTDTTILNDMALQDTFQWGSTPGVQLITYTVNGAPYAKGLLGGICLENDSFYCTSLEPNLAFIGTTSCYGPLNNCSSTLHGDTLHLSFWVGNGYYKVSSYYIRE